MEMWSFMATGKGSGRASAGQFSDNVVDGIMSSDNRPEGKIRKHWPKPGDSVELWLTAMRDKQRKESPEWWTIQGVLMEYITTANKMTYLGNTFELENK